MKSAETRADKLYLKIHREISLGNIAGPFYNRPMSSIRWSPIGLVPKKKDGGGWWRMICNLSAPQGNSVNDIVDPSLCLIHYTNLILLLLWFISSAFRLLSIGPEDFSLLGFYVGNDYYIN